MTDHLGNPTSPADVGVAVTPSDSTVIGRTKGLYIGVTGSLVVTFAADQSTGTFVSVIGGSIYPFAVTQVKATGTTATNIVALY